MLFFEEGRVGPICFLPGRRKPPRGGLGAVGQRVSRFRVRFAWASKPKAGAARGGGSPQKVIRDRQAEKYVKRKGV